MTQKPKVVNNAEAYKSQRERDKDKTIILTIIIVMWYHTL
jgi:hypothetical protein